MMNRNLSEKQGELGKAVGSENTWLQGEDEQTSMAGDEKVGGR